MKLYQLLLLLICALILGLNRSLAARPAALTGRATDERGDGVEFATVVVYQFVVKTLRTTHVRVKVKLSQFKVRKNNLKGG